MIPAPRFRGFPAGTAGKPSFPSENPAIGYDHRITASTFLPFSGVFPSEPARMLSPGVVVLQFFFFIIIIIIIDVMATVKMINNLTQKTLIELKWLHCY
jgi:hypothetical protein